LEVIFEKFKGVARAHEVVLKALQRVTAEVSSYFSVENISSSAINNIKQWDTNPDSFLNGTYNYIWYINLHVLLF
jgi:hypothetical protein